MAFYINKIVGWICGSYGALYIGLLAAWFLRRKWPKTARGLALATLVFVWIMGSGVTGRLIGVPLEREFVREGHMCGEVLETPAAEAIVLLGGGIGSHEKCGAVELFQSSDRVRVAAHLWKAYQTKGVTLPILCTGGGVEKGTLPFLVELGVARESILYSDAPRTTAEEVAFIKTRGVKSIALVTSAWHMKRARMLFKRRGFEVHPVPSDFEMMYIHENDFQIRDFFPSSEGLFRNAMCLKEWVALVGYSIF